MTRRTLKLFGLLVAVCLLVGVIAALLLRPGLPTYKNQSLAFWLKNLPEVTIPAPETLSYGSRVYGAASWWPVPNEKNAREALLAIRAMGTNALPYLIQRLKRSVPGPAFDKLARSVLGRLPVVQRHLPTAQQVIVERHQAVTGLVALCPLPPETVRELRELSLDFQGPCWTLAGDILRANDDPKLRDKALSSYLELAAGMKQFRKAFTGGQLRDPPESFGEPELHDMATNISAERGLQLQLTPGRRLHQTIGFTNDFWNPHERGGPE